MSKEKIKIKRIMKKNLSKANWDDFPECRERQGGRNLFFCLNKTLLYGGRIFGAYLGGRLVGFAAVEKTRFGSDRQYCQLSNITVLEQHRRKGIGKRLFRKAGKAAVSFGAKKLYILTDGEKEAALFFEAMGCAAAKEIVPPEKIVQLGPLERPFECPVENRHACTMIGSVAGSMFGLLYGNMVLERTPLGVLFGLAAGCLVGTQLDRAARRKKKAAEEEG